MENCNRKNHYSIWKLISICLLAFSINAFALSSNGWVLEYLANDRIDMDPRFKSLVNRVVPNVWEKELVDLFGIPGDARLVEDTIFIVDGCKPQSCGEKGALFFNKKTNHLIFVAAMFGSTKAEIYILAKGNPDRLSTEFGSKVKQWSRLHGAKTHEIIFEVKDITKNNAIEDANGLTDRHAIALALFKNGNAILAADTLRNFVYSKGLFPNSETVSIYNDLGYFLQQAEKNGEAIVELERVISLSPNRTVAYLNLADAQFSAKQEKAAQRNYKIYAEMMKKAGKGNRIPKRVYSRAGKRHD